MFDKFRIYLRALEIDDLKVPFMEARSRYSIDIVIKVFVSSGKKKWIEN